MANVDIRKTIINKISVFNNEKFGKKIRESLLSSKMKILKNSCSFYSNPLIDLTINQ